MPTLTLEPGGIAREAGWATLSWTLRPETGTAWTLRHAVPCDRAEWLGAPERGDHALVVALLHGMRSGQDIHVDGSVSPRLLKGVETLQEVWSRWRADRYRRVQVTAAAEAVAPPAPDDAGALFAFSGGVDGSYSLFRHLQGAAGRNTLRPAGALMVHGMDIPLDQPETFAGALERGCRMLAGTGVPLVPVRTNSRALPLGWEDSFGLQLIGCMLLFQGRYSAAVVGSGGPYEALNMPWGSTPLTDPRCSTETMEVVHDGCGSGRGEKVAWLAEHTAICEHLRVCWAGPSLDRNCGQCEKCLRTMLNFWSTGHGIPACFPDPLAPDAVRRLTVKNTVQLRELERVLSMARARRPGSDPILAALQKRIRQLRMGLLRRRVFGALKRAVRQRFGT